MPTLAPSTSEARRDLEHIFDVQPRNATGSGNEFQRFQNLFGPVMRALHVDPNRFAQQTAALQYVVRARKAPDPPRRVVMHSVMVEPLACARVRVYEPERRLNTIPGFRATSSVKNVDLAPPQAGDESIFL